MERVARTQLLETIRADRRRFDATVAAVPDELMAQPILPGGWSVKDVLAHVAWGDLESTRVAKARSLTVGSDLWERSEDERNETVVRASRSRNLDEVATEYQAAFRDYIAALEALSDEDLNEPSRIEGLAERVPGWRPWRALYDPGHLDEHGRAIVSEVRRRRGTGGPASDSA